MKRIIVDQNILIGLGRCSAEQRAPLENEDNLIYVQDANLGEAWKSRPEHCDYILGDLLPFRKRVRLAPAHSEIFSWEKINRRAVTRRQIHSHNLSNVLSGLFDDLANGQSTIIEAWHDLKNRALSNEQYDNQVKVMKGFHNTVVNAANDIDRVHGRTGGDLIRSRLRSANFIEDESVLELCVLLAVQEVRWLVVDETSSISLAHRLSTEVSFHLLYYLTKYLRVVQKMEGDWIANVIKNSPKSSETLGGEYFDTLHVTYSHYFDESLTHDTASIKSVKHLRAALGVFHRHSRRIFASVERSMSRGKASRIK